MCPVCYTSYLKTSVACDGRNHMAHVPPTVLAALKKPQIICMAVRVLMDLLTLVSKIANIFGLQCPVSSYCITNIMVIANSDHWNFWKEKNYQSHTFIPVIEDKTRSKVIFPNRNSNTDNNLISFARHVRHSPLITEDLYLYGLNKDIFNYLQLQK